MERDGDNERQQLAACVIFDVSRAFLSGEGKKRKKKKNDGKNTQK